MTDRRRGLAITLVAMALAAGCGLLPPDTPQPPARPVPGAPATVLVIGRHANATDPSIVAEAAPILRATIEGQGYLALVVSDGAPQVEPGTAVFSRTCENDTACAQQIVGQLAGVTAAVGEARPAEPESDLLGALVDAERTLPGNGGSPTIVVADSGLSTAGPLRFQDPGVLAADPTEIADFLVAESALPDLTGITVVFTGLGDTAPPQPEPDQRTRANLRDIWSTIAARAGAQEVRIVDTPIPAPPLPDLPPVAIVPTPDAPAFAAGADTIDIPDAVIGFRPDTAVLRDPSAARELLSPLVSRMLSESLAVTLVGTTSSAGSPEGRATLSRQRAEAIKSLLVELGVPPDRITTEGAGYLAEPPDNNDGRLLPGPAAENRRVIARLTPVT